MLALFFSISHYVRHHFCLWHFILIRRLQAAYLKMAFFFIALIVTRIFWPDTTRWKWRWRRKKKENNFLLNNFMFAFKRGNFLWKIPWIDLTEVEKQINFSFFHRNSFIGNTKTRRKFLFIKFNTNQVPNLNNIIVVIVFFSSSVFSLPFAPFTQTSFYFANFLVKWNQKPKKKKKLQAKTEFRK